MARLLGDVWGHQVAAGLRAGAAQARQSAGNAGEMLREYLQGSRGPLARTEEIEAFGDAVDELGADAERLEARLRKYTDGPA